MESTLLHTFIKGTEFRRTAPLVFQDTLEGTRKYLILGSHLGEPANACLADFITRFDPGDTFLGAAKGLRSIPWYIDRESVIWLPKQLATIKDRRNVVDYTVLLALYFRVNGAMALLGKMRGLFHGNSLPKGDVLPEKIDNFVQRHFPLAQALDKLEDPTDAAIQAAGLDPRKLARPCGPTDYREDRDSVRVETRIVKLEPTPLEILAHMPRSSGVDPLFTEDTEKALARLAGQIRHGYTDEELLSRYVTVHEDDAFDYYYPIRMQSAQECRLHSWYLACLTMINTAWAHVSAFDDEKEDRDRLEKDDDEEECKMPMTRFIAGASPGQLAPRGWLNDGFVHTLGTRHALYRCMGGYVELFFHALAEKRISDESWRPDITSGMPSLLDRFYPYDTVCFHWGDLPALDCVLEHVGLAGVQVVKTKIPIVRILMKSMPVCCQSRDLVKCFLKECRMTSGEGYWRVVRGMFYCTLCGLYPGSERRADFRSMMRIRHMLFIDRNSFFDALEREIVDNKARPKGKKLNKACQLVYVVFREYFIYLVTRGGASEAWLSVVNRHIKWEQFVVNTLKNADEMRRCARIADAPKGNEFLFAINALFRCKDDHVLDVYRYRKKEYVAMLMDKFNAVQDGLNRKHRQEADDIRLMERLVEQEVLEKEDVMPLHATRHAQELFQSDPAGMLEQEPKLFSDCLERALADASSRYSDLSYEVEEQVKRTITRYLLRTRPADRFRFDMLLDERLGGVSRESVQALYKTKYVYDTRSSPKTIETYMSNLQIRDFRIFSWYFNIVTRLERFNLIQLDADMVEQQARAFRKHRFHLLPEEPLPPLAWTVYICICCNRIATFTDTATYGNFRISYDPDTCEMVCGKKMARVARARAVGQADGNQRPAAAAGGEDSQTAARVKKEDEAQKKKARAERKDGNAIPCKGQPVLAVSLYGMALEFGGNRYMFCPHCGQFHVYRHSGWGRKGYRCFSCRSKEAKLDKLERCAFCGSADRGHALKTMDILASGATDPTNPGHDPLMYPLQCYQTLHFCQKDANSAGLFARHFTDRHHVNLAKDRLWEIIAPANVARQKMQYNKYN